MIFQSFGIHLSILICQATHQLVVKIAFTNYFFLSSLMAHFDTKYHYLLKKNPPPKNIYFFNSRTLQSYVMLKIVMETIAF